MELDELKDAESLGESDTDSSDEDEQLLAEFEAFQRFRTGCSSSSAIRPISRSPSLQQTMEQTSPSEAIPSMTHSSALEDTSRMPTTSGPTSTSVTVSELQRSPSMLNTPATTTQASQLQRTTTVSLPQLFQSQMTVSSMTQQSQKCPDVASDKTGDKTFDPSGSSIMPQPLKFGEFLRSPQVLMPSLRRK